MLAKSPFVPAAPPAAVSPLISAGRVSGSWRLPPALPGPPRAAPPLTCCPQDGGALLAPPGSLQGLALPRGERCGRGTVTPPGSPPAGTRGSVPTAQCPVPPRPQSPPTQGARSSQHPPAHGKGAEKHPLIIAGGRAPPDTPTPPSIPPTVSPPAPARMDPPAPGPQRPPNRPALGTGVSGRVSGRVTRWVPWGQREPLCARFPPRLFGSSRSRAGASPPLARPPALPAVPHCTGQPRRGHRLSPELALGGHRPASGGPWSSAAWGGQCCWGDLGIPGSGGSLCQAGELCAPTPRQSPPDPPGQETACDNQGAVTLWWHGGLCWDGVNLAQDRAVEGGRAGWQVAWDRVLGGSHMSPQDGVQLPDPYLLLVQLLVG